MESDPRDYNPYLNSPGSTHANLMFVWFFLGGGALADMVLDHLDHMVGPGPLGPHGSGPFII